MSQCFDLCFLFLFRFGFLVLKRTCCRTVPSVVSTLPTPVNETVATIRVPLQTRLGRQSWFTFLMVSYEATGLDWRFDCINLAKEIEILGSVVLNRCVNLASSSSPGDVVSCHTVTDVCVCVCVWQSANNQPK